MPHRFHHLLCRLSLLLLALMGGAENVCALVETDSLSRPVMPPILPCLLPTSATPSDSLPCAPRATADTLRAASFSSPFVSNEGADKASSSPPISFKDHLRYGIQAHAATLIKMDAATAAILHNLFTTYYGAFLQYQTSPHAANAYDAAFGYPSLELGVLYGAHQPITLYRENPRLSYNSRLGYSLSLYGSFRRAFWQRKTWKIGYNFENGIGFMSQPYDKLTNADNELIGAPLNIYLDLGLWTAFRLSETFEATLGIDYKHFSNSALDRPNKGANTVGVTLRLAYLPTAIDETTDLSSRDVAPQTAFRKGYYTELAVGGHFKTLQDDWVHNYFDRLPSDPKYRADAFTRYGAFMASVAPMYRYALRYASGVQLDYLYAPYARRLQAIDTEWQRLGYAYSPHVVGLALRHEVFFRQLSLSMALGYYLHRKMGWSASIDEKKYYELIGLRYHFPFSQNRLFLGFQVKAHFTKADAMQWLVGYRL